MALPTLKMLTAHEWGRDGSPLRGHQMSLDIAAGLKLGNSAATRSYPDLFQPYGGFPDGVKVVDSHIEMSGLPVIGLEGKADLHAVMRELAG